MESLNGKTRWQLIFRSYTWSAS